MFIPTAIIIPTKKGRKDGSWRYKAEIYFCNQRLILYILLRFVKMATRAKPGVKGPAKKKIERPGLT